MRSYSQYCALARALDRVGDRWTMLIVRELLLGPMRYSDLCVALHGVASNLLSERLKQLESDGLVTKAELPPPSAAMVYQLTDDGEALREAVHALIRFGGRFMASGRQGDAFSARWLGLAFEALAPVPPDLTLTMQVRTPDGSSTFRIEHGGVSSAEGGSADVVVEGDTSTLLAATAGLLPSQTIAERIRFSGRRTDVARARHWLHRRQRG